MADTNKIETAELPSVVGNKFQYKALRYGSYATELSYDTVEVPTELGETQVLIKTKATSVNPVDVLVKALSYGFLGAKRKGFGGDFSGIVVKSGSKSKFQPGDNVFGSALQVLGASGSFGEYFLFDEAKATLAEKIPEGMTFAQAASLPIACETAFQALKEHGHLEGKNVLILGAGTTVGSYGVQFAKHHFKAANVVATCSAASAPRVKSYGADLTIDYTKGATSKVNEVLEFVKEHGKFDIILDTVRDTSFYSYSSTVLNGSNKGGVYSLIAGSSVIDYKNVRFVNLLPTWPAIKYNIRAKLSGEIARPVSIMVHRNDDFAPTVDKLFQAGQFQIIVDSEYDGLTHYKEAVDKVAAGKAKGKVVCLF